MIIYAQKTGKFVREMADADNVPMSTKLAMPTAQLEENQYYSFRDENDQVPYWPTSKSKWVVKTKFEKCTAYNKETQEQKEFDDVSLVDDDYTLDKPPSPYHTFGENGWELTAENEQQQLLDAIITSTQRIDTIAATVTQKWSRFAEEYKEREAAAASYQSANFEGDVSVYISSFAEAASMNNKDAALLILQQAASLRSLQEQLAVQRMRKYELKRPKLSVEEIQTLTDEICTNIQTLGDSYE